MLAGLARVVVEELTSQRPAGWLPCQGHTIMATSQTFCCCVLFRILFIYVCLYMHVGTCGGQKRVLGLQAAGPQMWVLGAGLWSSESAASTLKC